MSISLGDALLRAAATDPERDAVVLPGERWSYGRLAERAQGVARSLAALGVAPGDRVAVLMPNSAECLAALFGTALAGATVVPINARFKAPEMRHILADSAAKVVLTSDLMDAHANLSDQLRAATTEVPIVLLGAKVEPGLIGEAEFDALGPAHGAPGGRPARHRDAALHLRARPPSRAAAGSRTTRSCASGPASPTRWTSPRPTRVWNPCPMFHIAAIGVSISCVVVGAANVTTRFFDPDESVELLARRAAQRLVSGLRPDHARRRQPSALRRDRPQRPEVRARGRPAGHAAAAAGHGARREARLHLRHDRERGLRGHLPRRRPRARADGDRRRARRGPRGAARRRRRDPAARPAAVRRLPQRSRCLAVRRRLVPTRAISEPTCTAGSTFRGRKKEMLRVGGENVAPAQIEATPDGAIRRCRWPRSSAAPTIAWTRSRTRSSSCAARPPRPS